MAVLEPTQHPVLSADRTSTLHVEVKNNWSYIFTALFAFKACTKTTLLLSSQDDCLMMTHLVLHITANSLLLLIKA